MIIGVWVEGSHFRLTGDRAETLKLVVLHQHWHGSQLPGLEGSTTVEGFGDLSRLSSRA